MPPNAVNDRTNIPLILSGPPRSGTTMFSALLDGHSALNWFIDEGFFFEHLHVLGPENFERFCRAGLLDTQALIDGMRDRSLMPPTHTPPSDFPSLRYEWSEDRFRQALAAGCPPSPSQFWKLLRDAYLAGFGYSPRRFVSLKAADYGRSVFGALDLLPEARGIVIVREPIAALSSLRAYRRKRGAKLLTWPTLVAAIADMNRLAELLDNYPAERLLVIRYEDVTNDLEGAMRRFCTWLGVAFEPALLTPTMMGQPWSNNSSFGEGESGRAPLPAKRAPMLSDKERDYVSWALEPFRNRFGYGSGGK